MKSKPPTGYIDFMIIFLQKINQNHKNGQYSAKNNPVFIPKLLESLGGALSLSTIV